MSVVIKDNMLKEDFEDMFDKIKRWVNDNIHTEKDAEKFAEDPSPLIEELGLYTLENLYNYLEETFREDSDMMKGIKQSALLVDNMPIDEVDDFTKLLPRGNYYVLYCDHGGSSMMLARYLGNRGYMVGTVMGGFAALKNWVI